MLLYYKNGTYLNYFKAFNLSHYGYGFTVITKIERYKCQTQQNTGKKLGSLLFVTLAIWFVFSIGIFLFAAEMNEVTGPFGYPWTYWFTCQGSLGIL